VESVDYCSHPLGWERYEEAGVEVVGIVEGGCRGSGEGLDDVELVYGDVVLDVGFWEAWGGVELVLSYESLRG
jgi:hypothetical protein